MTASRISQPRVFANFKPSKTERLKEKRNHQSAYERRAGNSAKHLAAIKKCPCAVPGCTAPSEPHHLKQFTGERGAGMRSTDKWVIPLCHDHHINGVETVSSSREHEWLKAHGVERPLDLASALFGASPDEDMMTRIVEAHRNG